MAAVTDDVASWLAATLDAEHTRGETLGHFSVDAAWLDCPATRGEPLGDLEWGPDACDCGRDRSRADILASVEVDRAILALHEQVPGEHRYRGRPAANPADPRGCVVCDEHDGIVIAGGPCATVLLLASRYRHRPGWRDEWKP